MSCISTLYNVMQVMTHGHSTASGSCLASLFCSAWRTNKSFVVVTYACRVRAWQRIYYYDNAATCAIIAKDMGRVADCIERADHFWTLRSDEECLAFDNNYIVHCNLTIFIVEVVAFVVFSLLLPQPL